MQQFLKIFYYSNIYFYIYVYYGFSYEEAALSRSSLTCSCYMQPEVTKANMFLRSSLNKNWRNYNRHDEELMPCAIIPLLRHKTILSYVIINRISLKLTEISFRLN